MVPGLVIIVVLHCQHVYGLFQVDDHASWVASLVVRIHIGWPGPTRLTMVQVLVTGTSGH